MKKGSKDALLEALKECPIVTTACVKKGIGRATYYRWTHEDVDFQLRAREAMREGIDLINDMSESQLISLIRQGRMPAITLWLKHHHPRYDRGDSRREAKQRENGLDLVELVRRLNIEDEETEDP